VYGDNIVKRKKYNENYFEKIDTEEKSYFLGFICADGCIVNNPKIGRYLLTLKLHIKDKHILEKFISNINGNKCVWEHGQREMVQVSFSGKKIINDLSKLGVIPNKTFNIKYPSIDKELERHFLRGYFDGDGCIRINKDKRDNSERGDMRIVSGSIEMLNTINERMHVLFNTNINKLYGPKNKNYKNIGWAGMKDIENIYHGFYDDSNVFLYRKKDIFDNVIKTIKNKKKYRKK